MMQPLSTISILIALLMVSRTDSSKHALNRTYMEDTVMNYDNATVRAANFVTFSDSDKLAPTHFVFRNEVTYDNFTDYIDISMEYIIGSILWWMWLMIALHCVVFLIGLVGNSLVCVAVYRNHTMRTVTNYFIVNLAVADFLVILFCLPPSLLWDVTSTWWFGATVCKVVLYLQVGYIVLPQV
ncbi:unnamed protein product [Acanthoscelides obtectus]|uniref:G-protein coupled receptors family 1 profile domain-containing protein n=1 Tax=Acanthoscelides obtectus TaxID=200917 RepID=A0A9P0JRK1_ACAOB|nr:unnamed protein product [Acanthoscelides obtectus]CAK1679149.1 Orexin receptor type 1 [Acanthoscelides obtectus]